MKKKLVFATNNAHKLEEVTAILGSKIELLCLKDIGCEVDIPETADTLEGNAMLKAAYIRNNYGLNCFADDTGLEVEALNGEPGVYSARYAGEDHCSEDNMRKLLY
ncbi:MAG: non-canonical purine NTP pyrophosphatase, partial [Bacteroides sp.]